MMLVLPQYGRRRWMYFALLAVFYLSFSFTVGLIHAADAFWYEQGSVRVSALYPMLLALFRLVFTEALYRYAVIAFQQLLLAYAIFSLTDALEKELGLSWYWRAACCAWLAFMLYAFRLVIIGGNTETFFCNAILTEGIAYPLYLLFFKYWFLAQRRCDGRMLLSAACFAFLLTGTRGQFFWLLIALLIGFLLLLARKGGTERHQRGVFILKGAGVLTAYILLTLCLSSGYHLAATGSATGTTLGAEATLAAVLYDCDEGAADFLPDGTEESRVLKGALATAADQGWLVQSAKGGWMERYRHYESSYDEVRKAFLRQVAAQHGIEDERDMPAELLAESAAAYSRFVPRLIAENFLPYIQTRCLNFAAGLIRSNAMMGKAGAWLSGAVYAVSLLLLLLTRRRDEYAGARLVLGMTMLFIFLNAAFCCFGVFALSRYMYYNFPLAYLSLFLFLPPFFANRKPKRQ